MDNNTNKNKIKSASIAGKNGPQTKCNIFDGLNKSVRRSRRPDSKAHRVSSFTLKKPEGTFPGLTTGHYSSSWNRSYRDEIKTWMSFLLLMLPCTFQVHLYACPAHNMEWLMQILFTQWTIITWGSLSAQQTSIIYFSKDVPATRIQILKHRNCTFQRPVPLMYCPSHPMCIFKNIRTLHWISSQWGEYFVVSQWSSNMEDLNIFFEELRVKKLQDNLLWKCNRNRNRDTSVLHHWTFLFSYFIFTEFGDTKV